MAELFKEYGLDAMTIDFIGHAIALHCDDAYLSQPALPTIEKIKLYNESLQRFAGTRSPYIYPLYGLGSCHRYWWAVADAGQPLGALHCCRWGLPMRPPFCGLTCTCHPIKAIHTLRVSPTWLTQGLVSTSQGFARLGAVYGATYMLSKPDATPVFEGGKFVGVSSEGETVKANIVVGDPSYFPQRVQRGGRVVRAICILSHPIPNTDNSHSVQIILPQRQVCACPCAPAQHCTQHALLCSRQSSMRHQHQFWAAISVEFCCRGGSLQCLSRLLDIVGDCRSVSRFQVNRRSDIYVFCSSYEHNVAAKGKWIAFVSTTVETQSPEQELLPGWCLQNAWPCKLPHCCASRSNINYCEQHH